MEDSKQSDQVVELGKRMYAQFDFVEKRFDFVDERIDELETIIQRLFWFIEFHLGEIPMKYMKANPGKGEYPYFKSKTDFQKEWKGRPKPASSEAFSLPSESRGSNQLDKIDVLSPSSDEPPGHKSPPFQT